MPWPGGAKRERADARSARYTGAEATGVAANMGIVNGSPPGKMSDRRRRNAI